MINLRNTIIYNILIESSIHGCYHVVVKGRTLFERIFWLFIILFSMLCATSIIFGQWRRYQENPTVISIQTNYKNWFYEKAAVTLCSNYTNAFVSSKLIQELWNITKTDKKYNYYNSFVETVATTRYNNLNNYANFINDKTLVDINLLDIMTRMYENIEPPLDNNFHSVITEMGFCFSSSKLHYLQDPFNNRSENTNVAHIHDDERCGFLDVCKDQIKPDEEDESGFKLFFHDFHDIISMPDQTYIIIDAYQMEITLSLSVIQASDKLKLIQTARRKCYFFTESVLQYFDVYTPNLCKIDCKIKAAINLCGCRPFFYNYDKAGPACNPAGMHCLAMKNWNNIRCNCLDLCVHNIYSKNNISPLLTENKIPLFVIQIIAPKTRILRDVLFSFEDLLVSYGGAAGLFLGCSFISGFEIIFFLFEYFVIKIKFLLFSLMGKII